MSGNEFGENSLYQRACRAEKVAQDEHKCFHSAEYSWPLIVNLLVQDSNMQESDVHAVALILFVCTIFINHWNYQLNFQYWKYGVIITVNLTCWSRHHSIETLRILQPLSTLSAKTVLFLIVAKLEHLAQFWRNKKNKKIPTNQPYPLKYQGRMHSP